MFQGEIINITVPEFIDAVFAKTASINSGTAVLWIQYKLKNKDPDPG
jgi:hypothetical protein